MKHKGFLIYTLICYSVIVPLMLFVTFSGGTGVDDILKRVKLKVPHYELVSEVDNLDRYASRFDWYSYKISFPEADAQKIMTQVTERNGWETGSNSSWSKTVIVNDDLSYQASVCFSDNSIWLEVYIDETYGSYACLLAIMFFLLHFYSVLAFLAIYLIKKIYTKIVRKK